MVKNILLKEKLWLLMRNTINLQSTSMDFDTPKCLQCFLKVCNTWTGHIILIHSNLRRVKSSQRIDASLMLCQTYAFYLVTRQQQCLISIAEPAGNALLHYGDTSKQ